MEKVTQTNHSVGKITDDSDKLGEHIHVIDSAIKEVEHSNSQLVANMEQVSQIVDTMTSCTVGNQRKSPWQRTRMDIVSRSIFLHDLKLPTDANFLVLICPIHVPLRSRIPQNPFWENWTISVQMVLLLWLQMISFLTAKAKTWL